MQTSYINPPHVDNKLCIDLFSGLGGWSSAFKERGWEVITIDNEPEFNPTLCVDIMDFDPKILPKNPIVILASPPCQKFSTNVITLNWRKRKIKDYGVIHAIGMVAKALDIIYKLQPLYWIIENPRGMLRNVMGKPAQETYFRSWGNNNLKPTDIWGILPDIHWPKPDPGWDPNGTRKIDDAAEAAKIPYKLSLAICQGIEKEVGF